MVGLTPAHKVNALGLALLPEVLSSEFHSGVEEPLIEAGVVQCHKADHQVASTVKLINTLGITL